MGRDLDIIVFGASGFTGKHVLPILHKLAKGNNRDLKWGVAGRSEEKLKKVLKEAEEKTGSSLADIPVIIADVANEESLKAMASRTRIVVNCCGPYHHFGEPVVKACISEGAHYVDISAEPLFMQTMQYKYHEEAQQKGVYIISACGFDSIPTDLGVVFLQQKFPGTVNSVVVYLEGGEEFKGDIPAGPKVNFGTWESVIYGLATIGELIKSWKQLYPTKLPEFEPKLKFSLCGNRKTDLVKGWILPFLSGDRFIVMRSQRYFYEHEHKRPAQIQTYVAVDSFWHVFQFLTMGFIFALLTQCKYGRKLLLKYPRFFSLGVFSHEPPSEERFDCQRFSFIIYGEGWKEKLSDPTAKYAHPPDTAMVAQVRGRNPGYGATCVCLVLAAIVVLTETDKLPSGGKGGVYPPGAAFANTSLVEQLNENGLEFEIVSQTDIGR